MVNALVVLDKDTNRVLNVVKAKYDLKTKGEAIKVLAEKYIANEDPQLRPEYVAKLKKIMKQKSIHIGNIEDFRKRYE
jgi:predicted component of type VI protein secretion system